MSGIDVHKNSTRSNEENQVTLYPKMSSSEEFFLAGESRISKDRRRFTVVTVFDVCLTALLWVISTVSKGSDWPVVFFREIDISQPDFMKLSLFDVVITAVIRMFILILFYSILLVGHWLPVAITTIATTIFLLVKALFFFSPVQGNLPQYTVLVSSFVVAWFQLWLVPFHILPRERRYMIMPYYNTPSELSERNVQTDEEFRSAMEYSSDSDDDNLATLSITGKVYSKAQYIEEVERAKLKAKELLTQISFWKLLHRSNPEIRVSKEKQIYYVKDTVACSPKSLFKIIWKDNKLWNKQITNFKVLLHIDAITELVYITTAPILRGYIAPRDFLDVRRMMLDTEKDIYEGAYISIDSPIVPINGNQKLVRALVIRKCLRLNGFRTAMLRATFQSALSKDRCVAFSGTIWIALKCLSIIIPMNIHSDHGRPCKNIKNRGWKM
ncbi:StAR-related lipid transfer protein [Dirofilaria immitis]